MAGDRIRSMCVWAAVLVVSAAVPSIAQQVATVPPSPTPVDESDPRVAALAARRVRVDVRDVPLEVALETIAAQAKLKVMYVRALLANAPHVTIRVVNMPAGDAFRLALRGTNFEAVIGLGGQVSLARQGESVPAQGTGTVVGRVTDSASGRGVGKATVRVQGSTRAATTSDDGQFTLRDVPTGDQVLTVRLFGYQPSTRVVNVSAGAQTTVHILMISAPTVLSGVVTTATGTQRKLEVGSDIAKLNVDSIMQVAPITSVTDLLESRVPGVTVQRTSGTPGAPARIRLRGVGSPTLNNDPIVIVDGVRMYAQQSDLRNTDTLSRVGNLPNVPNFSYATPSPLDQIDPNSIETIEVLRGPSASAMYGSDAGNGVIVITTKRGRAGPTRVSATLGQGFSFQPGSFPVGLYRFGHVYNQPTQFCALTDPLCTVDSVVAFQALNDPQFAVTTGHGTSQELSGLVSGGVSALTYALNGSYSHTTGQLKLPGIEVERFTTFHGFAPPSWMRRPDQYSYSGGSGRLDLPLGTPGGRSGTASLTSNLFKSDQQQSSLQTAISKLMGMYIDTTQLGATTILPEFYERATHGSMNVTNALTVTWPVASWLPVTATAGANLQNTTQQTLTPRDYILTTADSAGHFAIDRGSATTYTLNVNTTVPSRWANTALGFNFTNSSTNDVAASVTGLPLGVTNPTSFIGLVPGQNTGVSTQSSVAGSTYGWFAAPTLNFHSRFFLTPGFRLDGSSASGGRVSTSVGGQSIRGVSGFPKMDFSWLAVDPSSERQGLSVLSALSLLRLRGAVGTAGRQPDPAAQLRLFTPDVLSGGDILRLTTLGNTVLRPERSRELEYGMDAELWRGRVTLGVTGARKTTHDAIISVTLPPSIGGVLFGQANGGASNVTSIERNIGTTRNTDLEMAAQATLLQRAAVTWDIGASVTHSSSLVVSLDPSGAVLGVGSPELTSAQVSTIIRAGYPINGLWAHPILGYDDTNGDGIIQANEVLIGDSLQYVGQPLPTYEATFNTNLILFNGRLTAHTTVAYQNGMTQFNAAAAQNGNVCGDRAGVGSYCYPSGTVLFGNDPSAPLSQQAAFAALSMPAPTAYGLVQVVNTLRWQSLSVNYVAPQSVARLLRTRQLMIAFQGSNLGLHTNYHGNDPNVNAASSGERMSDYGQLPLPRTFTLKLTLGN